MSLRPQADVQAVQDTLLPSCLQTAGKNSDEIFRYLSHQARTAGYGNTLFHLRQVTVMSVKENRIDAAEKKQLLEWVQRLEVEMRLVFGEDERRIKHALRVAAFAEELLEGEPADPYVVMAAAYLHDIGIHEAERKHGSAAGKYQEIEGPPIAEAILRKMGAPQGMVDEVCEIVAYHHSPGKVQTANFAVLWDSDWLVNLPDEHPNLSKEKLRKIIDAVFLTESGRRLACGIYLPDEGE